MCYYNMNGYMCWMLINLGRRNIVQHWNLLDYDLTNGKMMWLENLERYFFNDGDLVFSGQIIIRKTTRNCSKCDFKLISVKLPLIKMRLNIMSSITPEEKWSGESKSKPAHESHQNGSVGDDIGVDQKLRMRGIITKRAILTRCTATFWFENIDQFSSGPLFSGVSNSWKYIAQWDVFRISQPCLNKNSMRDSRMKSFAEGR